MQYHVVRASLPTSAIPAGLSAYVTSLTTASSDSRIYLNKNTGDGIISVNGSRILTADASTSNGLVHTIDQVLIPPLGNVLRLMQADTSLSLLVTAIQQGGAVVTQPLSGTTALTVFAPTNAALRAAGYGNQAAIQVIPAATLANLLTNHVVTNARTYTQSLTNGATLTSASGGSLTVTVGTGTAVSITSRGNGGTAARVLDNTIVGNTLIQNRNATAINGVLHKIDRVLLP